ncbi:MAG: GNAT family N-acetyltransferase [Rhodospirillaceae bacterium]|nr:GNAT family N-acetyltransferase [Rhodospirillaceae bacterium]
MTSVHVRRATARDTNSIASVVKESWLASNRHFLPEDSAKAVLHGDRLADTVTLHWQAIQVAEVDGKIVGAVGVNDLGHMWMLYVLPGYQGLGIGSALYNAAIDSIRKTGKRKAMLEVLAANESAVAFYRTRGWVPEGRRTEHIPGFRFTAVRMGLALP